MCPGAVKDHAMAAGNQPGRVNLNTTACERSVATGAGSPGTLPWRLPVPKL